MEPVMAAEEKPRIELFDGHGHALTDACRCDCDAGRAGAAAESRNFAQSGLDESVRINTSAVERRAATLVTRRTVKKDWQIAWLLRAISCMD